jgi:hypothetical protein
MDQGNLIYAQVSLKLDNTDSQEPIGARRNLLVLALRKVTLAKCAHKRSQEKNNTSDQQ